MYLNQRESVGLALGLLLVLGGCSAAAQKVEHHGSLVDPRGGNRECLACHDGAMAKGIHGQQPGESGKDPHLKAGVYPPPGKENKFRPAAEVRQQGPRLVNGGIACSTCHNLKDPGPAHLIMSNDGSRLCLTCHLQ